jgi:CBS domain containing-hemolysin-like protein
VIPLILFLLACLAVYLGAIDAAFSALMRLSLRLSAERSERPDALGAYLDDPILLFGPVRVVLGITAVAAAVLIARLIGVGASHTLTISLLASAGFVLVFEMLLPLIIVGRDPERMLALLLPSFAPFARAFGPVVKIAQRALKAKRAPAAVNGDEAAGSTADAVKTSEKSVEPESASEGEERQLLRSIVDFSDTLVREVMTPRPDIVAILDSATIGDLRALFREQEYSRFPVFKDSLDNIIGFVFVKDLVALSAADDGRPISQLLRPAVVAPESKRVSELLKQFQRQQTQIAIVVDEYGGTAGLVTIEDMLEEIVGEIRDEYDVESEPVVEEADGGFVFSGRVDIDEVKQRLNVHIEREGFETVGGYLLTRLGRVPAVGERVEIDGLRVEILEVERRRIHKVRLTRPQPVEAMVAPPEAAETEASKVAKSGSAR